MGETVVVYGVGLIGLGVVAACVHRGCVVIAVDVDDQRLDAARRFGANYAFNSTRDDIPAEVRKLAPAGADVVFEASGVPALIDPAIALCRKFGKFVWQGNYGEHPIAMHFMPAHGRQLTMFFPCDDGLFHCRRAVLRNMALGALPWQSVITHVVEADDTPAFFDQINRNAIPGMLGATIHWSD
jgi:threonine dehydrogenase-like Zn-dependent dehydrogenase